MAAAASSREWDIYLLAGVGSPPGIFADCIVELKRRFGEAGREPVIRELFPYGDHREKLFRQIMEVQRDVTGFRIRGRSGGDIAAELIRRHSQGRPVLLIGHSGGGIAAYHAALRLAGAGVVPDCRIIQVGSPRVPIREEFRSRVSYYQGVDEAGKSLDPITRLGRWGGWRRNGRGLWYWDKRKHAPGRIGTITVLGGHPHYFRHRPPFVHPDRGSNLSSTLQTIWSSVAEAAEDLI